MTFGLEALAFPVALLTALGYRLKFGKRRLSSDDTTSLMFAVTIIGSYGLFIFLAGYALGFGFGDLGLSISFLASGLVCGLLAGWAWVKIFVRYAPST